MIDPNNPSAVEQARAALEPFAAWITKLDVEFADDVIAGGLKSASVTFGDLRRARAALAALRAVPQTGDDDALKSARPLPFDRDTVGRMVREAWVRWALTQPNPKPSWLVPYDELSEADKEADRQIGSSVARWTLIYDAATRAAPQTRGEEGLAAFAREIIDCTFEGHDADGDWIQSLAVTHGLLVETTYDPDKHGPSMEAEPGDRWFEYAGPLARLPAAPPLNDEGE